MPTFLDIPREYDLSVTSCRHSRLLELDPATGYTLKQRFDGTVQSFWTVTQSQIYRELHTLQKERLVVAQREAGDGKPDRKVYALTDEGRTFLKDWLLAPLEPLQLRRPLLLKLVFAADVEPAALDEVLARYAASLEESPNGARPSAYVARDLLARPLAPTGRDMAFVDRTRARLV